MVYLLFESKTKKMNKLRASIIPFNLKIQQEWAENLRCFEKSYAQLLKDGSFAGEQNLF